MIITFNTGGGNYVYIASQHIVTVERAAHGSIIGTTKGNFPVTDSVEQVLLAIKEASK